MTVSSRKGCFYWFTNSPWKTPAQLFCFHADFSLGLFYIHSFLRTPPPLPHAHVCAPLLLLLLLWSDRMHCAHVPCPRVPITHFFPRLYFCLVGLSSTSAAAALSAAEYYKRWRAERGFVNGRRDVCQLTDQRAVGTSADAPPPPRAPPPSPHPTYPGTTSSSPGHHASPSRWMGVSRYQFCHHAGVAPNPPASCAFHNLKARLSYLVILDDFFFFFVWALCGPGSSLPSVLQLGSAKSMAAELD